MQKYIRLHRSSLLQLRQCFVRSQYTSTKTESKLGQDSHEQYDPESNLLRQKQFNQNITKQLRSFMRLSGDNFTKFDAILKNPLTAKEKLLDEKLSEFLEEFSNTTAYEHVQYSTSYSTPLTSDRTGAAIDKFPFLETSSSDKSYTPQELFLRQLNHSKHMARLGATLRSLYFPQRDISNPLSLDRITIKKLMESNVHLGQSVSLLRPSNQQYIYGEYKGIHIIDLNKTLTHLKRASSVIEKISEKGGIILYIGTKPNQKVALERAAKRSNGYYVASRWIPGTLTNSTEISSVWGRHEVDAADLPTGRQLKADEKSKIVKPDLLVILNPNDNRIALYEAMKSRIPTIGIIDTDSESSLVTYPIPGNDDSFRSVNLILGVLSRAAERGLTRRLRQNNRVNIESTT
ncbi:hypothetical protein KAFR_0A01790 [Kazachstania africana CBS 2517]|uniref:Ribosomal protein S2 n=1 Tax=Kazachstania africana (strain ATCC 22294 / BCRC 22015 / CBS 2517 / CECT 1963 / NBRC 1671 / NRRL Y-8276) TaxID=1071382 RepID=H2AML7_KAZAF|nr:hypothetical protein KAFR_0A01790 [Kazachstania africana CBS 2517]CCF55617.1 hypothetical protein KAFR_0A01790 [Kazachstania africana CBS 2517]